jgi:hypothetical protein
VQVSDLTVEIRDSSFARVGLITAENLVGAKFVLRFNNIGSWSISLRGDDPLAALLRAGGAGIFVTGPNGTIISGPTTAATLKQTQEDPIGVWDISGLDDTVILDERLAYPTPSTADVAAQTSEYDTRSGIASTIIYAFVNANIGPSAPTARKITNLTLTADTGMGSTVAASARFESLGQIVRKLAQIDRLGFDINQVGTNLVFTVYQPQDLSASIRMDINNNRLLSSDYGYTAPQVTRAIVAGQGDGVARTFVEVTTSGSTSAESTWGRRIEQFVDGRSTNNTSELTNAGTSVLNETGQTITALSVTPTDMDSMRYQVDWNLGDTISVVVGSDTVTQVVQEVGISVESDGVRLLATVGYPQALIE